MQLQFPLLNSDDEDLIWLFERTVKQLQLDFGHSEAKAGELANSYLKRFTDSSFCSRYGMSAQTPEFFFREEALTLADRIHYYEALGREPDELAFIQWERSIRLKES